MTRRAAVLGHPISHSRSPRLHGHWLKRYGIDGSYTAREVPPGTLEAHLRAMQAEGFVGANVTLPHKEEALALADHATERAREIGAANTLTFGADGRIEADNTDGYGFLANLRQGAPDWRPGDGPALILGAGGAARALIVALRDAGVPRIYLANRTRARAEALAEAFGPKIEVVDWEAAPARLPEVALLVNSTSQGMTGGPDFTFDLSQLAPGTTVTDIVYTPLETPLLATAKAKGCRTVDGLGMLLHQGVPGFERWFGQRPEVDEDLRRAVLG